MHLFCWMNKYSILWIMQSGFILVRSDCYLVFFGRFFMQIWKVTFCPPLPSLSLSPGHAHIDWERTDSPVCVPFISLLFLASFPSNYLSAACLHICMTQNGPLYDGFFLKFTLIWQPLFDEIYLFPHYFALLSFPPLPLTIVLAISSYSNCSLIFIFI